jgi:diadenosine tetraphosphate (Ap4A) HIT family hydrolase
MGSQLQNCVFCERILQGRSDVVCDQALAENDEYVVVPTKGSLVPGWLLVVAKVHVLCAGASPSSSPGGLQEILTTARRLIEPRFGPVTLFEHGPVTDGTALGCGVDHLHIHAAPLAFSLRAEFQRLFPESNWRRIAGWQDLEPIHSEGVSYVAVQEPGGPLEWCEAPPSVRQPLRRAIAAAIGAEERFDYNVYPYDENVVRTIEAVSAA